MNVIQPNNGEHGFTAENITPAKTRTKRHNAKLCSLAIRERIVNALAAGDSQRAIARHLQVSPNTVRAVAEEEWRQVDARKARIAAQSERNATRAAELIAEKLEHEHVPLNVLVPVFGVRWTNLLLYGVMLNCVSLSISLTSTFTLISRNNRSRKSSPSYVLVRILPNCRSKESTRPKVTKANDSSGA